MLLKRHCGDEENGRIGLSSCFHYICIMLLALCLLSCLCVMNQSQSVRVSEQNSVVVGSNPTQANFLWPLSGEYQIYRFIPLHSYDYLNKILIKTNMVTNDGNSRNEMKYDTEQTMNLHDLCVQRV